MAPKSQKDVMAILQTIGVGPQGRDYSEGRTPQRLRIEGGDEKVPVKAPDGQRPGGIKCNVLPSKNSKDCTNPPSALHVAPMPTQRQFSVLHCRLVVVGSSATTFA